MLKPEFKGLSATTLHTEKEDDNTFRKESERVKLRGEKKLKWMEVLSAKKTKVQPPISQEVLQHTEEEELGNLPKDAERDPIFPDPHI